MVVPTGTTAGFRQRLSPARCRIRGFLSGHCGIANPANPCRCARRVDRAVAMGRVDPANLSFAGHPVRTRQAAAEMQHLHDVAAVVRSHPEYAARQRVEDTITELVRPQSLTLLRA